VKAVKEGQCLRHAVFGVGIVTAAGDERTTIDFYEHGSKKFVTHLLEAELVAEAPPRAPKPRVPGVRAARKASLPKVSATK
jgi:hypothetical protein